ncbi:hypothetical protein GCK32_007227 [Trichostrongylus colubriformis]|uniref:Uncharacterized protein n=1 Tax=Trichostrongylus colubriformis TaxID=6319 RepID=A0AAN8EY93_TRICO
MVKRGNGLSPQKDLRRSSRERSMVYRSLAENDLAERHLRGSFMKSIIRTATAQLHKELIQAQPAAGYTRSGRRIAGSIHYEESDSSDEREYEKRRRRRYVKEEYHDENVDVRSPSPKRGPKEPCTREEQEQYDLENGNMYDTIKRERKTVTSTSLPNSPTSMNGSHPKTASESARSLRHANRERLSTGDAAKDEPNGDVEGSQSSEEVAFNIPLITVFRLVAKCVLD